jgi:glycosyltransferase involved in cell wall biosynthesis
MLPREFTKGFSWKSRLKEVAQRVLRWLLPMNVGFRRRCKYADLILCKTDDTIQCVPEKWRGKCVQMTDVAVERRDVESYLNPKRYDDEKINYVAAGTLVGWRTMDVLIEAWLNSQLSTLNSQLTIVGDGPERGRLERLVDELGVRDSVRFVGQVDMETYYSYIAQADVVVNPCFREGAVTVSFDSMAMGKPLICFDTGGYTHYFKPEYSRVIKGVKSRTEAVERLARAMAELADRELIAQMGAEAKRRSEELSWEKKIESIVNSQGSIDNSPVGTT